MGTFTRSYELGGERFEIYEYREDGESRYQIFDEEGLPVGDPFDAVPAERVLARVIEAVRAATDPPAA